MPAPARRASSSMPTPRRRARSSSCSCGPNESWDFGLSATWVQGGDHRVVPRQRQPDRRHPRRQSAADFARAAGGRPPPRTTGTWLESLESYVRFTVQYVGSSFTQLGDQEPNFGLISNSAARPPGSARLIDLGDVDRAPTSSSMRSCRRTRSATCAGASARIAGKPALFVNNLWDERAFLSVDRERGRSARVGYPHQPAAHLRRQLPHELLMRGTEMGTVPISWQKGTDLKRYVPFLSACGRTQCTARFCCSAFVARLKRGSGFLSLPVSSSAA